MRSMGYMQCSPTQVEVSTGTYGVMEYTRNCPNGGKAHGEYVEIAKVLFKVL